MLVLPKGEFLCTPTEMSSGGMIYMPSLMMISSRFKYHYGYYNNLWGCNIGITGGRYLWSKTLKWSQWHDTRAKFHENLVRHVSKIMLITETIWYAVILVLLMQGFINYAFKIGSGAYIHISSFINTGSAIRKLLGGCTHRHTDTQRCRHTVTVNYN
jgi:hypothetical protein